jgi:hypothetical protein
MLSLSSLAGWEEAVLASIRGTSGNAEERDRQIERSGMYGEYPAIVRAYIELFDDEASRLEATKRAVFLVWRSAMGIPVSTGIAALPEGTSRAVIEALDELVRRDDADDELAWMLGHYAAEGEFVFDLYGGTGLLLRFAADAGPNAWRAATITAGAMARRGQMGFFWLELAATSR